jgi:hypothetical protein
MYDFANNAMKRSNLNIIRSKPPTPHPEFASNQRPYYQKPNLVFDEETINHLTTNESKIIKI